MTNPVQKNESADTETWFQELITASGSQLLRFLRSRLSQSEQAQDLAQEVYLRLLRVDDLHLIRNPRAFAIRVAANVAYEWRMLACNRMPHSSDSLLHLEAEGMDPAECLERQRDLDELTRVLAKLPVHCQQVLLMQRRDGMSCPEIAAALGLSLPMVKKHLARGLALCHKHLGHLKDRE